MPAGTKHTKETFLATLFAKYPENEKLYCYKDSVFVNIGTKWTIVCKTCNNIFSQTPSNHLGGNGCPKCFGTETKTHEQFVEEANKLHNSAYNYLSLYEKREVKIQIQHKSCGHQFEQTPNSHLRGSGCPKCAILGKTKSHERFVEEANKLHNSAYNYLSRYVNTRAKIQIQHKSCGHQFEQTPSNHLRGNGCPKCFGTETKTHERFVEEANKLHNSAYNYLSRYVNTHAKIQIQHKSCGHQFEQTPNSHLRGNGCPKCCGGSISKPSQRWLDHLYIPNTIGVTREVKFEINGKKITVDGYDPNTNTIYEFHGDFWHGNPKLYDPDKKHPRNSKKTFGELFLATTKRSGLIRGAGYNLVSIWESEWEEQEKSLLLKETA